MSPFFDNLEDQLRAAARALEEGSLPPARRRRWEWLRSGARAVPIAIAVGTTVAVAVAALLLLGHQNRPSQSAAAGHTQSKLAQIIRSTPRATLRREGLYMQIVTQEVERSHRRLCVPGIAAAPSLIQGSPDQRLLSMLGVLRRPQAPADQAGERQFASMPGIYASSIRRAFAADGVTYYIAAAHNDPAATQPAPRCFGLEVAALHAYLPRIPESLRAPTLRLQSAFISVQRTLIAATPTQVICTATVSRNEGGTSCGFGAAQIDAGIAPSDVNGTFTGVVPDGVATVTIVWRGAHGVQRSATASALSNLYAVRAGRGYAAAIKVTWRSAQGQIIKTISPPSARALARYCGLHPAACVAGAMVEQSSGSASGASFRGVASAPPSIAESSSSSAAVRPPNGVSGSASSGSTSQTSSSSSGG